MISLKYLLRNRYNEVSDDDSGSSRWLMLAVLAVAELLGMSLWLVGSAVAPKLAADLSLAPSQLAALTTAVQLGFVLGTALSAVFSVADSYSAKRVFVITALLGAAANLIMLLGNGYSGVLLSRFLTGVCLAGVYPPAMKMAATWFKAKRGVAVGVVVGALTVGKALPYLAQAVPNVGVAWIVVGSSISATAAAIIVGLLYRDGPYAFPSRPFSFGRVGEVLRTREFRLATGGYLGHMIELYSYWTWIPAFLIAHDAARATAGKGISHTLIAALGFGVIAIGGIGCVWGGNVADRIGRERFVNIAMAASGTCALLIGFTFAQSWWLLTPIALIWGFFVVADSAQFSVLVTESVPQHAVGTALTVQVSLGFLLSTLTIQLVPTLASHIGWQWVFPILAIGPMLGITSIRRLQRAAR